MAERDLQQKAKNPTPLEKSLRDADGVKGNLQPGGLLVVLLAMALVLITQPGIRGNDGVQNYAYLRSMLVDGDLNFTNDYGHYLSQQPGWFDHQDLPRDPVTGLPMNLYGVGSALLWSPYVLGTHLILKWLNPERADGFSRPYERAVSYGTAFHVSIGLWLLWLMLARRTGRWPAFAAILIVWLGTPLFLYAYLHPSMSHGNSFLAAMLMWTLLDSRAVAHGRPLAWGLLGASGGLLVLTRFQDGILILTVVVAELLRLWYRRESFPWWRWLAGRLPAYGCALIAGGLMLVPQLAAWSVLQGAWFTGPRAYGMQGSFRLTSPHLLQVWFSSYHGLFHWHPVLLFGLGGLLLSRIRLGHRAVAIAGFLGASYVIGCWSIWWAGASFGHRMFISALPLLGLGLGLAVRSVPRRVRLAVVPVVVAGAILWNFGAVFQYGTEMIPRNRPVSIGTLAYNNVWEIPRRILKHLRGGRGGAAIWPLNSVSANAGSVVVRTNFGRLPCP